jgi:hypothetical protein
MLQFFYVRLYRNDRNFWNISLLESLSSAIKLAAVKEALKISAAGGITKLSTKDLNFSNGQSWRYRH